MSIKRTAPTGWDIAKLEDVVDILDSKRVPVNAKERETRVGQVPYYGATGQVGWIDDYLFDAELVLLGEDGAPFLEAAKRKAYLIRGKSWVNNHAHVLKARSGIPNAYIKYYLDTVDYHEFVTGTTRLKLNQAAMRRIPVPLAPPEERARIVAEIEKQFSRLDEAVASLKRVKANLKRYKNAVLKAAIEGKLTEVWRKQHPNVEPASKLLEGILAERRVKWTGRGEYKEPAAPEASNLTLPKRWTWATVDQLSVVVRGASPRPAGDPRYFGGTIPWITVGPITADQNPYLTLVPETVTEAGRERSRYLEPHTLLLTNSGATLGVPKITLIGGCINDGVAALLYVVYPLKLYLLYFLHTQTTRLRRVNQGAAQPNLNTSIIKAINVPLPPHDEQEQIVAEVERRLSVIEELEAAVEANLTRADRLRQAILNKAFVGTLITGL